jgi:K+-sensing histidine kinase KdpD
MGKIKGVCCLRRDVSDLVALKKELDHKDEKLSELIWQQSHLFRGPLSTAIGIADILNEVLTGRQLSADECREMLSGLRLKLKELDDMIRSIVKSAQG